MVSDPLDKDLCKRRDHLQLGRMSHGSSVHPPDPVPAHLPTHGCPQTDPRTTARWTGVLDLRTYPTYVCARSHFDHFWTVLRRCPLTVVTMTAGYTTEWTYPFTKRSAVLGDAGLWTDRSAHGTGWTARAKT